MTTQLRCTCSRCTIRGFMGPAVITTLGVLFLLSELRHGYLAIGHTYPILFIVIGAILLGSALAPMAGHVETPSASAPPKPPPNYASPTPGQGR
jgi:hypothetical protein